MNKAIKPQNTDPMDKPLSLWVIFLIPFYVSGLFAVILFPIGRDWGWLEAWVFIIALAINFGISYYLINKRNPRVLRNRMKVKKQGLTDATRKSAQSDWFIMPILGVGFFGALLLPAIDHRFGWSGMPFLVALAGLVLMNIGLVIMDIAMLQNAFASKLLDINKGQTLIDTGLYGRVRHPLYSGGVLMALGLPIALGSWWGLLPALLAAISLILRINFEEKMLVDGMPGYADYQKRVPYKLLPKVY